MIHVPADAPCVLFALRRESLAFRRAFRPRRHWPQAPCWMSFCQSASLTVLAVETGVGSDRTRQALQWLLGQPRLGETRYRPRVVVSAGFAGALQEELVVGDVVLAAEVVDEQGQRWPATWPGQLPRSFPVRRGCLLTAPRLVATREEKRTLRQRHGAWAVDMESALVAQLCSHEQVPFACLRSISDDAHTSLSPRLGSLLSGGRVSPWKLAANVLRAPSLLGELRRLARQTKQAGEQLALALETLLTVG